MNIDLFLDFCMGVVVFALTVFIVAGVIAFVVMLCRQL